MMQTYTHVHKKFYLFYLHMSELRSQHVCNRVNKSNVFHINTNSCEFTHTITSTSITTTTTTTATATVQ